jgi:hypothetical protein
MTEPTAAPDVIDNGTSDVLAEEEIVHVPPGAEELAESLEEPPSTFLPDVPHWDEPDPHDHEPHGPDPT